MCFYLLLINHLLNAKLCGLFGTHHACVTDKLLRTDLSKTTF